MLKLPNSIEPAVMAENIVHLRDGLAAVDAKTLPATTSAATGQILKLTGESKTPSWTDEYSYTPPAYSETEVNTGQKWIDGKDVYCITISATTSETTTGTEVLANIGIGYNMILALLSFNDATSPGIYRISTNFYYSSSTGNFTIGKSASVASTDVVAVIYYTKPDPVPGDAKGPEDEEEPEEKKTTRKKTTK